MPLRHGCLEDFSGLRISQAWGLYFSSLGFLNAPVVVVPAAVVGEVGEEPAASAGGSRNSAYSAGASAEAGP